MPPTPPTPGDDTIQGTSAGELLEGLGGDDLIYGFQGDDTLLGGDGDDLLEGGDGQDEIRGSAGSDTIRGGYGGIDTIHGGDGNDLIFAMEAVTAGTSIVYGGRGHDMMIVTAVGDATLYGGGGIDRMGIYWLDASLGAADIDLTAANPFARTESGREVIFSSVERLALLTGMANDRVLSGDYADVLDVTGGDNLVDAGGGADTVGYQLGGENTLEGGAGQDLLIATAGTNPVYFIADGITGGIDDGQLSQISGFEDYAVYGGTQNDIVAFWTGRDLFLGHEGDDTAAGRDGRDTLYGGAGDDDLYGDNGNDRLGGGGGHDQLEGDLGDDFLIGGDGNDTLNGSFGNDRLAGGRGEDQLEGGDGDDRLYFYLGSDTATGGAGADAFVFARNEINFHTLTDFETGVDHLEISTMLLQFASFGPGALDPAFFALDAAVGPAAQFVLRYDLATDLTLLLWDPNGSDPAGGAYGIALFSGQVTVAASDIVII